MSDEARYARVGAFVFGGIALAVVGALLIGGGALVRRPLIIETVFDESVQGLEVGSPVKLRGVKLGTVSSIGFVGDSYVLDDTPDAVKQRNSVLVRMEIESRLDGLSSRVDQEESVRVQVEKGLRLRVTPLGITGTAFIQADYLDPKKNPPLQITWKPDHVYVPSAPSTISQLSSAAERLMTRIDKLNVEKLLTNFDAVLASLNSALGEADVEGARKSVGELLTDLQSTSSEARKAIAAADLRGTSRDARNTLDQMTATLTRVQRLLDANDDDLATTLDNLRVASENLREASETARAYPSFLLFGAPPKPVEAPAK
jgi:phospholipid/cholesterol/gamma-HCH transport system substrate-binding protein/paraquat-inducible protein B